MGRKRMTLAELRERAQDTDQAILQARKILETHKAERDKLYSMENRRRLSEQGLREDEQKLRRTTEQKLAATNARIAQHVREAGEERDLWTYEHSLRTSRFAPEASSNPGTPEAQQRALNYELLETFRRGNAENRAARYTAEDLIAETERAALEGDVATLAVYRQAARDRKLAGVEKVNFEVAFKKLRLDEVDQAQTLFSELEGLATEADSLFTLWREPNNEIAKAHESLGRFNRRKKAEEFVKATLAAEEQAKQPAPETEQPSAA